MSLNFLTWFINWAMSYVIHAALLVSLGSTLRWRCAAAELEVGTIDGLWCSEFLHARELELQVTLSLCEINELSTGTNVSGLLSQFGPLLVHLSG